MTKKSKEIIEESVEEISEDGSEVSEFDFKEGTHIAVTRQNFCEGTRLTVGRSAHIYTGYSKNQVIYDIDKIKKLWSENYPIDIYEKIND